MSSGWMEDHGREGGEGRRSCHGTNVIAQSQIPIARIELWIIYDRGLPGHSGRE